MHASPFSLNLSSRFLFAILAVAALAVGPARSQTYTDPNTVPLEEFKVQGEYFGPITGGANLGCWVHALGGDSYLITFLPGGLVSIPDQPGGGWDNVTKFKGQGSAGNITAQGYTAKITGTAFDRTMTGKTPDGKDFVLKRLARKSPLVGLKAPMGAKVLYGDKVVADAALNWTPADHGDPNGYLRWGVKSKFQHKDIQLHIEFRTPFKPTGRGQDRGNSGIYLQDRYEMQVLESFGLEGDLNETGGIYSIQKALTNAALPPLNWQAYDCYFTAPVYGATGKTKNATMTMYLNGVLVQKETQIDKATTAAGLNEGSSPGPIQLQDHGNPVFFNNIWLIEGAGIPWNQLYVPTVSAIDSHRKSEIGSFMELGGGKWRLTGAAALGQPTVRILGMDGACLAVLRGEGDGNRTVTMPRLQPGAYFLQAHPQTDREAIQKITVLP
jgi:hypothetical protein